MNNKIIIAVDAMGGENSPKKIVDGIELSLKESDENFFKLYGNKDKLNFLVNKKPEIKNYCEIKCKCFRFLLLRGEVRVTIFYRVRVRNISRVRG